MNLELLRQTEFDSVTRLDQVWVEPEGLGQCVDREVLEELVLDVEGMASTASSPLGRVMTGAPGAGKTHLLRHLRGKVREKHGFFFLIDCTDIRDFWSTLMLGVVGGLDRESFPGWTQASYLRYALSRRPELFTSDEEAGADVIAQQTVTELSEGAQRMVRAISRAHPGGVPISQVLHGLFLMTSHDPLVREQASMWLQGVRLDDAAAADLRCAKPMMEPTQVLKSLTWLCSLIGPVVIAFDQLDALISQHHFQQRQPGEAETESTLRARAIIQATGAGLMGVFDGTVRTLTVLSCLESSWRILERDMGPAAVARYQLPPLMLREDGHRERVESILRSRIAPAARQLNLSAEPVLELFGTPFIDRYLSASPRAVLKAAEAHRRTCLRQKKCLPFSAAGEPAPATDSKIQGATTSADLDSAFERLVNETDAAQAMEQDGEDRLGEGLRKALALLVHELSLPDDVDLVVDADFAGGKTYPTLHARLRLVFRSEGDREAHVCVRVLQKTHHSAFRARLNASMVEGGIDRALPYRKLVLFRNQPRDFGGVQTRGLIDAFGERGGLWAPFEEIDARLIKALLLWKKNPPEGFEDWLAQRRPLTTSSAWGVLIRELLAAGGLAKGEETECVKTEPPRDAGLPPPVSPDVKPSSPRLSEKPRRNPIVGGCDSDGLPLGYDGANGGEPVYLPLIGLTKHVVIRAGSGGGKTVLIKRLIEEAALRGVSSVVLDPGNDLAQLALDWPEPPSGWRTGDAERAAKLREETEVLVHTPGRSDGRPLFLPFMPDFAALRNDPDDLQEAILGAVERLATYVAKGNSNTATNKKGLLAHALRQLAMGGEHLTLRRLSDYLEELPEEADTGISKADKLASELSSTLRSLLSLHPDLDRMDHLLDWRELFGLDQSKARISVINFIGIPTVEAQQQFVSRLAESLFGWMKQHPSAGASGITGMLVIDEARDFLPAGRSPACKAALMRLAAQARKYGVALVFATQNPKDLDYNAVAQFSTQYFGRANAPQVVEFVQKLLEERGARAVHPGRLKRGEFYVLASELEVKPAKVSSPMCLTSHPDGKPLTQDEIVGLARRK